MKVMALISWMSPRWPERPLALPLTARHLQICVSSAEAALATWQG